MHAADPLMLRPVTEMLLGMVHYLRRPAVRKEIVIIY